MSLYDAAKTILHHAPADNLDLRKAIMDLMNLALETDDQVARLRSRVGELEQAAEINEALILDQGAYWRLDNNGKRLGPYCPACWGKDRKLVPMLLTETANRGRFWAVCSVHAGVNNFTVTIAI